MWHNFQKYFHGDVFGRLWPAARVYRHDEYQHHMAKVFAASEKLYPYLRIISTMDEVHVQPQHHV
jgi:hypothetical protein